MLEYLGRVRRLHLQNVDLDLTPESNNQFIAGNPQLNNPNQPLNFRHTEVTLSEVRIKGCHKNGLRFPECKKLLILSTQQNERMLNEIDPNSLQNLTELHYIENLCSKE